jgi:MYXO-CTERM domain-containing protein
VELLRGRTVPWHDLHGIIRCAGREGPGCVVGDTGCQCGVEPSTHGRRRAWGVGVAGVGFARATRTPTVAALAVGFPKARCGRLNRLARS